MPEGRTSHAGPKYWPFSTTCITTPTTITQRPTTPENSSNRATNTEYSTPVCAKVKAVVEFNDAHKIPYYKEDVFRYFGIERTSAYADIDQIHKPHVKPLLDAGERFVLEEDNGSGHGSADNNNMVRLEYFFNVPKPPDLACVENCWQLLKSNLLKEPHWTDDDIMAHADYIWDTKVLLQSFIDGIVEKYTNRQNTSEV